MKNLKNKLVISKPESLLLFKKEGITRIYITAASLLLVLGSLGTSRYILINANNDYSEKTQKVYLAEQHEIKLKKQIKLNKENDELIKEALEIGLNPVQWTELSLNMSQQKMTREAVNKLMTQVKRQPDQYFRVEKFEISVEQPDQSIFTDGQKNQGLLVSLKGRSIIKSVKSK